MATKYNPFTDALDFVGSGGASYIDGVVADSSLLPTTLGTPALDSVYLAKAGSGVWLINRRPAGLYCRVANNGNAADWQFLGAFPEVNADGNWALYNSATPSKELKFDLSGISASTVRTLTVPDASGTIATTADFAAPPAIGNTTPNSGAFTTITASTSITGPLGASVGSVTAPVIAFGAAGTGFYTSGNQPLFAHAGGAVWYRNNSGRFVLSNGATGGVVIETNEAPVTFGSRNVSIQSDGVSGVLAQHSGTNPQTFRLYNTFTDASNYERGFLRWSSNVLQIGTEKAGTGSARALHLTTDGTARLEISANSNILQVQPATFFTVSGSTWLKVSSATDVETTNLYPRVNSTTVIGATTRRFGTIFADDLNLAPSASVTPANNGDLVVEATDNTTLTFKYKGSDGTVRSGTVALS